MKSNHAIHYFLFDCAFVQIHYKYKDYEKSCYNFLTSSQNVY